MTKKVRNWRGKARTTASVIKTVNKDSFAGAICPTNVEDQKQKFLEFGKTPEFTHRGTVEELEEIYSKPRSEIRFDLLGEAIHILKTVKEKYGDAENYYTEMYGERISKEEATDIIIDYLKENHLDGAMSVIWCTDLPCSGRMMWQGPHVKYRRPEARKYSMWIKDSSDNNFLREQGIRCLSDHEIGTHFFRSYNDGLQPWFADRARFGIRGLSGLDQLRTEEGLAAVNTILNARVRYIWGPALLYYIACKATEMTFKQLFEHLSIYVENPEWRWRHCVRVKRGLLNPNDIGGYGKDQCYFEGAVEILRNVDNIDFKVLMSGKVCYDEVQRVKKLARLDCIQMPAFMKNQEKYKKQLKQIAHMNGLHLSHTKFKAPMAYVRRLKKGRRIGVAAGTNKVRKKGRKGAHSNDSGKGVCVSTGGEGESDYDGEDSDGFEHNEDRFLYHQFALADSLQGPNGEIAFDAVTKNKISSERLNEINERNSLEYYRTVVNNIEKSKNENKAQTVKNNSKERVSQSGHEDLETDMSQSNFRCVSRASIQNMLNQRSNSLNSRSNKNTNAEGSLNLSLLRPTSEYSLPGHYSLNPATSITCLKEGGTTVESQPSSNVRFRNTTPLSTTTVTPQQIISHSHGSTSTVPIATDPELNDPSKDARPPYIPAPLSKSHSSQNVVLKPGLEGFIYPETDMLTDDMIKIKSGHSAGELATRSSNGPEVKLLTRRVKSAANVLPKLPD